jgi:predicted esterase YcpF (UPF0227 family)
MNEAIKKLSKKIKHNKKPKIQIVGCGLCNYDCKYCEINKCN